MKSIKELREQYQVITEKEDKEQRKLTALVRAGLFDAKKLPILKRALEKGVDKMTPAEKKILIDLLDSLMNQVVSNEPVYMKVKRNVQSMDEEVIAEVAKTPVTIADVPSIVVLKRKAVRVYPGGQQVGLYYSQQLDKYVTIPFGEAGITEEVELDESSSWIERLRDERAEETPYHLMTPDQKNRTKTLKVLGRSISRGDKKTETVARSLMALLQKHISEEVDLEESRRRRRRRKYDDLPYSSYYYDMDDDLENRRAERTSFQDMTSNQRKRTTPLNVLGRAVVDREDGVSTAAKVLMSLIQRRGGGKSRLDKLKKMRSSPERKKRIADKAAQIVQQRAAKAAANAASAKPKQSAATSGTMQNRIRQVANQKTISEKKALKEAILLKIMERQQLQEYGVKDLAGDAADIAIPGVSAYKNFKKGNYLSAAGDLALDVGSVLAAPITGGTSFAGRAALKGALKGGTKLAAKSGGKKGSLLRNLKAARLRNARRNRRGGRRRDLDFNYYGGGGGMGGGSLGPILDRSKYAKDVTYTKGAFKDPTIREPQYRQTKSSTLTRQQNLDDTLQRKALLQRESVEVNLDGNLVEINSNIAEKLITVYESLNDNNKQKMVDMLMNEETQNKILEFVRRY